jgi:Fe-S-cluster-containing hydrogenase component 2
MYPGEKRVMICDLCGGDPQCVAHCPERAIQYVSPEEADHLYKTALVKEAARVSQGGEPVHG